MCDPAVRFNDIAWAESEDYPRGVIAGALENGSIDLWDADKLFKGERCADIGPCASRLRAKCYIHTAIH